MDKLPSLKAVKNFAVAARLKSFTAAAQELNVTQGAVSRIVQSLENDLGVQLFRRSGRFLTLTEAGELYYQQVSEALLQIADAGRLVRQKSHTGGLSVVVNSGFATRWLVPRLSLFQKQYPQIYVEIVESEVATPEDRDRPHVVIRYGKEPWPGKVAERLAVGSLLGVVCSPDLKASAKLTHPKDLLDKPLLSYSGVFRDPWDDYLDKFQLKEVERPNSPRFYQLLMLAEAAMSGLGYALVPLFLFEGELRSGRLTKAVPQTVISDRGYYITHEPRAESDFRVRAFKNWLLEEAERCKETVEARWMVS